jgi:hypothetical protein
MHDFFRAFSCYITLFATSAVILERSEGSRGGKSKSVVGYRAVLSDSAVCAVNGVVGSGSIPVTAFFNCIPFRNCADIVYARQSATTTESIIADACYTFRYRYACQAAAIIEIHITNACYAFRYRYARQAAAI